MQRLQRVMQVISTAPAVTTEFKMYTRLMDRFVGNTVDFDYAAMRNANEALLRDGANDWVLAFQGKGLASIDRVAERWRATRTHPWLVAALWKLPPNHAAIPDVLSAASAVDARTPGFATVAVLRVRLLTRLGRRAEARALLASLPHQTGSGVDAETLNFLKAQRMMLATTFDEVLANAARMSLSPTVNQPVFDADAGGAFTCRPTGSDRILEAAQSTAIPDRLESVWPGLCCLARLAAGPAQPAARAATIARSRARTCRRSSIATSTPRMRTRASAPVFSSSCGCQACARSRRPQRDTNDAAALRHSITRSAEIGGCGGRTPPASLGAGRVRDDADALRRQGRVRRRGFLRPEETAAVETELRQLVAIGNARDYLARETIKWAKARPTDVDAAEALARVVTGGRWICSDRALSRQSFQLLHKLFPKTEWARRTRYWY